MAKISQERRAGRGGLPYPVIHPTLTKDTAGVLAGRSSKRKTLWLKTIGGFIVVFASLSAEQNLQETPELPLFTLKHSDTRQEQERRPAGG